MKLNWAAAGLLWVASFSASAGDYFDEVRFGIANHDSKIIDTGKEEGWDVNAEVLFKSPKWMEWAYSPRPNIGINANLNGKTDILYVGLAWMLPVVGGFWVEPNIGFAANDGELNSNKPDRRDLGCHWSFHESLAFGYNIDPRNSALFTVEHSSNASFCKPNQGISNISLRYGYKL